VNLGDSIRSGVKWLLAGSVGNRLLQFGFGVALARLLVPADFGMLVTVQVFTGLAGFVAAGGMAQALVRAKDIAPHHFHVVFTAQLLICTLLYALFFHASPLIAAFFEEPLYEDLLRVSALSFLLRPFANAPNAKLQREMRFKAKALTGVVSMLVTGVSSVLLALAGFGVWALIWGGLIGTVSRIPILMAVARWAPAIRFEGRALKEFGTYGFKLTVTEILTYLKQQVANVIISRMLGPGPLGLFNRADSLGKMPRRLIAGAIGQPLFRGLATIQDNRNLTKYLYYRAITLTAVYIMPFYVGIWWLAEPFIAFVYGPKWLDAVPPLEILALAGLALFGGAPGSILEAHNRLGKKIRINVETLITMVIAVFIGLEWGLIGVAWALVVNRVYTNLRFYYAADELVGGGTRGLVRAMAPAYGLCSILWLALFAADQLLFGQWREAHAGLYLLAMAPLGAAVYGLGFVFLPIRALASETARWRSALGIPLARPSPP